MLTVDHSKAMELETPCTEKIQKNELQNTVNDDYVEIEIPFDLFQYLSSSECNIQSVCRICLSPDNSVMFELSTKENNVLAQMFTTLTSIQVMIEDGLPAFICESCQIQVVHCFEFKSKCEKSDYALKSVLKGEFIGKTETLFDLEPTNNDAKEVYNAVPEIKEETDLHEDIQYLENLEEIGSDNQLMVQSTAKRKKFKTKPTIDETKEVYNAVPEIKEETNLHEDIQYLENLEEIGSDNQLMVLNTAKRKKFNKKPTIDETKEVYNAVPEIKEETDLHENIQYLENLEEIGSDNQLMVLNTAKRKKFKKKKHDAITDSNSLLKDCVPRKKNKCLICTYCSKKFHKSKTLHAHIRNIHGHSILPFSCEHCNESLSTEHDLLVHSALHSKGSTWSCNQCPKEFSSKSTLRRHIQRHMESKPYSCETCGKTFVEMYALRRHVRVHTGETVEKKHACHICDKRYSESRQLAVHIGRHSGLRPCKCSVCGKSFPTPRLLASHALVHNDDKPYPCLHCDKRFRHESTRNTHHRTHTGEKPYVCSFCGKTFIQNSNLTLHMRTHTGERPYSCNKCERKFTSGSSLKAHERTHTGERPYSCKICGKRFARMNMNVHMRQHAGAGSGAGVDVGAGAGVGAEAGVGGGSEGAHTCRACGKRFTAAWRLRDHSRVHTGERPFECATCMKKFPSRSYLVKHIKTHKLKSNKVPPRDMVIVRNNLASIDTIGYKVKPKRVETPKETSVCNEFLCESQDVPMEVSGELILQDESSNKTELSVVDNSKTEVEVPNANNINVINDINFSKDVNLVTVNEGGVSISSSAAMLEGASVKLYQLDQSLVQIHSSGGQVTISKITSKMTANF